MRAPKLLVISKPNARFLTKLADLPDEVQIVVGDTPEAFKDSVHDANVILNCFSTNGVLAGLWPRARSVEWVHSLSAGLDKVLFPELIESPVPLTNSRGVFAESLGEFVIAAVLFFAKQYGRLIRNQALRKWETFDVEMISGKTMGIVGYGSIGRACAWRAKALGMKVLAMRRRPEQTADDALVVARFAPDRLREMLSQSDYVVVSAALTEQTRGLIGEVELNSMKPEAIIINVGRGPVIDEPALLRALAQRTIRGAALDVFDQEPLPAEHPLWGMENVLISPHCADHTPTWLGDAMDLFTGNFDRFSRGLPLENVVDKRAGY